MPDHGPHDDDHAWLLARERGEPTPTISDARASRYAQLDTLIADLPDTPAGVVEHEGWEQGLIAALDVEASRLAGQSPPPTVTDKPPPKTPTAATRHRRRLATAAAVFAMVASAALVVFLRRAPGTTDEVDPGGSSQRPPDVTRGTHVEPGRLAFDQ